MPTYRTLGYLMIEPDYSYKSKYWKYLSNYFIKFYGKKRISDPNCVQRILMNCFGLLSYNFRSLVKKERRVSFYLFVHNFHENSVILWRESISGNPDLKVTNGFPAVRRILKLILEEATLFDLKGHSNFEYEISLNYSIYLTLLEEILYVGIWYYLLSEYIAKSKLFPNSISLGIEDDILIIYENYPYNHLFEYIEKDIPNHDKEVAIDNNVDKIKATFKELGIDYDVLGTVISEQPDTPSSRFALVNLNLLIDEICSRFNYDKTIVQDFYSGLTLSRRNTPFLDQRVLANQNNHRIVYRPILEYKIDNATFYLIGYNKWLESFTSLSTNAIPWGEAPEEWLKYNPISNLVRSIQNYHDKVLEEPLNNLLKKKGYKYDTNVKAILTSSTNSIRIDKAPIGEIDLILWDESRKQIIIGECKHNRSRFDFNNWRRDYSNFTIQYETKLLRKVEWCESHIELIIKHFQLKFGEPDVEISHYTVTGIFIINAPTLYMYNGKFKTYTLHDFNNYLEGIYHEPTFKFLKKNSNETIEVTYPFFTNLEEINY